MRCRCRALLLLLFRKICAKLAIAIEGTRAKRYYATSSERIYHLTIFLSLSLSLAVRACSENIQRKYCPFQFLACARARRRVPLIVKARFSCGVLARVCGVASVKLKRRLNLTYARYAILTRDVCMERDCASGVYATIPSDADACFEFDFDRRFVS